MRFKDKVALISAAANGIGRATATIMAREGATVIAVDNHQGRLDEAIPALRQAGSKAGGKTEGRLVDALDAKSSAIMAALGEALPGFAGRGDRTHAAAPRRRSSRPGERDLFPGFRRRRFRHRPHHRRHRRRLTHLSRRKNMAGKVGFIGLGAMGGPMALNLVKAGFTLVVNDIDAAKAEPLKTKGCDAPSSSSRPPSRPNR